MIQVSVYHTGDIKAYYVAYIKKKHSSLKATFESAKFKINAALLASHIK